MLVIYVNFLAQPQERIGEGMELPPTSDWGQFPALLSARSWAESFLTQYRKIEILINTDRGNI